jgi:ubiquinone/menaquinone biosynthesis C-methylase UbiE
MDEKYTNAEKQLITTLAWFRSRYALFMGLNLDRKADWASIEAFGKVWIGDHKENWDKALVSLQQNEIITCTNEEYKLTELGETVKTEIDAEEPFYKYEYNNYFSLEGKSKAHSLFCEKVYGKDMSQHGLIDQAELQVLIDKINTFRPNTVLDIGCGNGKITEWISQQTQTNCAGMDISNEAVKLANERVKGNNSLHFFEGNLNSINSAETFDCILFLDTLYYANSLTETIKQAIKHLNKNGRIYAYFSQWIMDENYSENLHAENTHLAKALRELKLSYSFTDLTTSGINHWKRKLEVLNQLKTNFIEEGHLDLWDYRYREANRYANWGDTKYSRYLYEIYLDQN